MILGPFAGQAVMSAGLIYLAVKCTYDLLEFEDDTCWKCEEGVDAPCKFVPSGNEACSMGDNFTIVEHEMAENPTLLYSLAGMLLSVGPPPWAMGAKSVHDDDPAINITTKIEAHVFNLIGPLRDAVMFHPESVANDELWDNLTRVFDDCSIKHDIDDAYTVDEIRDEIINPSRDDIWLSIERFLEESATDLSCLATGGNFNHGCPGTSIYTCDRCANIAAINYIYPTDRSNCWVESYVHLYPDEVESIQPLLIGSYDIGGHLEDGDIDFVYERSVMEYLVYYFAPDVMEYQSGLYEGLGGAGYRLVQTIYDFVFISLGCSKCDSGTGPEYSEVEVGGY